MQAAQTSESERRPQLVELSVRGVARLEFCTNQERLVAWE